MLVSAWWWLQDQLEHQQAGVTPSTVYQTPFKDYDALISLREEALPYPDRAVPGSAGDLDSSSVQDDEDDGLLSHKKARARLHSIPRGEDLLLVNAAFICS